MPISTLLSGMPEPPTATTINKESVKATVEKLNQVLVDNDQADNNCTVSCQFILFDAKVGDMKIFNFVLKA